MWLTLLRTLTGPTNTLSLVDTAGTTPPTLNWSTPAAITYGTALGATQLNASANVPGIFSYSPGAGTGLHAGNGQVLSVTFTPNDTTTYAVATATTTISVAKAGLTVRAVDKTKAEGSANPPLTVSYTGFVTSDNASVLDTPPTMSTTATTGSAVGTYPITASGLADNDYVPTYVDGTLTVQAPGTTSPPGSSSSSGGGCGIGSGLTALVLLGLITWALGRVD